MPKTARATGPADCRAGHKFVARAKACVPKAWSAREARQYGHIRDACLEKKRCGSTGKCVARCKRVAAMTVNKARSRCRCPTRYNKTSDGLCRKRGGGRKRRPVCQKKGR